MVPLATTQSGIRVVVMADLGGNLSSIAGCRVCDGISKEEPIEIGTPCWARSNGGAGSPAFKSSLPGFADIIWLASKIETNSDMSVLLFDGPFCLQSLEDTNSGFLVFSKSGN